ncbi:DUF3986 family protein [Bacillus sp. REN10]|uniref:DUF3986 family protein n=1 Tax=Bacillus sp. REN10 TaxID=2782541 RepID=UPI00193B9DEB|nr:DUF3986 family protein [Bacillus sp. REN10]
MKEYEQGVHLHIGYYEDGHDIEVVAYKALNEDYWDVIVDEHDKGVFEQFKPCGKECNHGLILYTIDDSMIDGDYPMKSFKAWLKTHGFI